MSADRLFSDEIRARERVRWRRDALWGVASFLVHLLLFAVIILMTPVRSLVFEEKPKANPAADLSADRIEDIGESLSEVRFNELMRQIRAMQAVLHNMDLMKEELAKDYDLFAEKTSVDVRTELEKLVAETELRQTEAVRAQDEVSEVVRKMNDLETKSDLAAREVAQELRDSAQKLADEISEKTNSSQANAVNALDRLQVKAEFAGFRKTADFAGKVRDAQIEAGRLQDEAQKAASSTAWKLSHAAENARFLKEADEKLPPAKAKRAEAAEAKAEADAQIAQLEPQIRAEEKRRDALRKEKKWNEEKESRKLLGEFRKKIDSAKRRSRDAQRDVNAANRTIAHFEKRLPEALEKRRELEKVRREETGAAQIGRASRAATAQRELNGRIEDLKRVLAADRPELEKLAREENRTENPLVAEEAARLAMTEAYDLAKRLESAITESYKDVKATETALTRKMSFGAAQKITDVARPDRLVADAEALESKPRTKEALDRQKAAQSDVIREADNMVEATVAMMNEAIEIVMGGKKAGESLLAGTEKTVRWMEVKDMTDRSSESAMEARLAEMEKQAAYQVRLEGAAAEDNLMKSKDLASLMAAEEDAAPAADAAKFPVAGPPPLQNTTADLAPGNVMRTSPAGKDGVPAQWMYVSSWYVIGPFPNPNRINLRRKFAPESVQDLDATYVGKDGRVLKWTFMQANNNYDQYHSWGGRKMNAAEIEPLNLEEYAIYYAYAEVFMEEACDRWIAIGSDDRSDVWINDLPVWGSSNRLKNWRLAEDFRRVRFRKGRNRILLRLENGHRGCGWSLCIATADSAQPGL